MLMNKLELIEALKKEAWLMKNVATAVVSLFFDEMADALTNGDRVEIRGMCSFYVKKYNAYTGHNRPLYMDSVLLKQPSACR